MVFGKVAHDGIRRSFGSSRRSTFKNAFLADSYYDIFLDAVRKSSCQSFNTQVSDIHLQEFQPQLCPSAPAPPCRPPSSHSHSLGSPQAAQACHTSIGPDPSASPSVVVLFSPVPLSPLRFWQRLLFLPLVACGTLKNNVHVPLKS